MARLARVWSFKKGGDLCRIVEQIRLSPAPKLGSRTSSELRFPSVSQGCSTITDLELGTLAMNRRSRGLPPMQRMWSDRQGFSLGYAKRRGSQDPANLVFLDPKGRLYAHRQLPSAVVEDVAGVDQWIVSWRERPYLLLFATRKAPVEQVGSVSATGPIDQPILGVARVSSSPAPCRRWAHDCRRSGTAVSSVRRIGRMSVDGNAAAGGDSRYSDPLD